MGSGEMQGVDQARCRNSAERKALLQGACLAKGVSSAPASPPSRAAWASEGSGEGVYWGAIPANSCAMGVTREPGALPPEDRRCGHWTWGTARNASLFLSSKPNDPTVPGSFPRAARATGNPSNSRATLLWAARLKPLQTTVPRHRGRVGGEGLAPAGMGSVGLLPLFSVYLLDRLRTGLEGSQRVSVHSGGCDRPPQIGHKQQNLFLTALEAGRFKIKG